MIAVFRGFRGRCEAGGLGGVTFTVPGSDGMMLVFLGLAFVGVIRDCPVFCPLLSSYDFYRRF